MAQMKIIPEWWNPRNHSTSSDKKIAHLQLYYTIIGPYFYEEITKIQNGETVSAVTVNGEDLIISATINNKIVFKLLLLLF